MGDYGELQARLGYRFRDEALLRLALTHPSVTQEKDANTPTNQRLEFLGDAVLQVVLSRALYERLREADEGVLTKIRARLVNRRALAERGRALGLGPCLVVSRAEERMGGRERLSALADAFEAVIGAVMLDGGFEAAEGFVLRQFAPTLDELPRTGEIDNPKGDLQEILQAVSAEAPRYEMVSVSGPEHDRVFEYVVVHRGLELGRGRGKSKKSAQSEAARAALEQLRQKRIEEARDAAGTGRKADEG